MKTPSRTICFEIDDFEAGSMNSPSLAEELEFELPQMGVFVTKIDVTINICCVMIEAPDVAIEDVLDLFRQKGLTARVKEEIT